MTFFTVKDAANDTYRYVEMQSTETIREELTDEPLGVKIFSVLLIPLILFGLLVWVAKYSKNIASEQKKVADENTAAIKLNNELLRENLQLQREILEATRSKID